MREDGPTHKVPDGSTVGELFKILGPFPPNTPIRMLPETWGDGNAELRIVKKADGVVYIEVANI